VKELLGVDFERARPEAAVTVDDLERKLAFLPPQKQEQVRAVRERNAGLEEKIKRMSETQIQPDGPELLQRFAQMKTDLRQVMSPEEYERYDMSTSWTGENLRRAMVGFNPTEEEFRMIFRTWRPLDEALAEIYQTKQPDPGNDHVFAAIRAELGEERYREYRRSWWNHDFHALATFTQDQQLPADVPGRVYDLKQATMDQISRIRGNPAWTDGQREVAVSQALSQASWAAQTLLGPTAYPKYLEGQGTWLATPPAPRR
jgi:hypothetical protein